MLEINEITKKYDNFTAVDHLTFKVVPGRIFGLIGPNGAGKTTTLRIILNIINPSSGSIKFYGKEINHNFRDIIGYLPEERGLYRKSRVIDVIMYFAGLKRTNKFQAYKSAHKWLEQLEISHLSDRRIEELSKGTQQKVQFISAIVHDPQILILDEPFTGLDLLTQQVIKDIIIQFLTEGRIIILSTHLMEFAELLCRELLLINKGKAILNGSLAEIKNKFSHNIYKLEFEGNPFYLRNLPGIKSVNFYDDSAELKLEEHYSVGNILKYLVNVVNIKSFTKIEPSLNSIFIKILSNEFLPEDWYGKDIKNSAV